MEFRVRERKFNIQACEYRASWRCSNALAKSISVSLCRESRLYILRSLRILGQLLFRPFFFVRLKTLSLSLWFVLPGLSASSVARAIGTNSDGRCCVVPAACNDDSREAVMRETSPKSPRARRWPIKFVHRARSASYTHIHKASSSSSNHHYQQQQSNSEPSCIPFHHCLSLSCSTVLLHIYVRICVCTIWSSSSFFGRRMCVGLVRQGDICPKLTFNGLLAREADGLIIRDVN